MRIVAIRAGLTLAAAGGLAVAGLAAGPALASSTGPVPCSTSALATAISAASSGEVLQLANCTYSLTTALPSVTTTLSIDGPATLQRTGVPHFSVLSVGAGGDLTTGNVTFSDGYNFNGGAINGADGPVTVRGGTFSGNYASHGGGAIFDNVGAASAAGGGIYNDDDVVLASPTVRFNTVNNCSPTASVTGCTG